jgi:hypothetical protein
MNVQPCKRWTIVYDHDGAPVEGCTYVHKAKAQKRMKGMSDPKKFRVEQVAIMSVSMANQLLGIKDQAVQP